jgi:hypothetical protein
VAAPCNCATNGSRTPPCQKRLRSTLIGYVGICLARSTLSLLTICIWHFIHIECPFRDPNELPAPYIRSPEGLISIVCELILGNVGPHGSAEHVLCRTTLESTEIDCRALCRRIVESSPALCMTDFWPTSCLCLLCYVIAPALMHTPGTNVAALRYRDSTRLAPHAVYLLSRSLRPIGACSGRRALLRLLTCLQKISKSSMGACQVYCYSAMPSKGDPKSKHGAFGTDADALGLLVRYPAVRDLK